MGSRILVRVAALLVASAVLVACGGPGSNLVPPNYVLEYSTVLDDTEMGPAAFVRSYYLSEITQSGARSDWYDDGTPVAANGTAAGSVDAREIPFDMSPVQFLDFYLNRLAVDVTVSNPDARLKVMSGIQIQQVSIHDDSRLNSHLLYHEHHFDADNPALYSTNIMSVFTDVPVSIGARRDYTSDYYLHAELELEAGWNLLLQEWNDERDLVTATPWSAGTELTAYASNRWLARTPLDDATRAWAIYPAHLAYASTSPLDPISRGSFWYSNGTIDLNLPSWIHPDNPVLVSLEDALPADSLTVTGAPATLEVVLGAAYGFDDISQPSWYVHPDSSDSRILFQDSSGNTIVHLYANQWVTVHLEWVLDGHTILTPPTEGLLIGHGWNALVLEPGDDETTSVVRRYNGTTSSVSTVVSRPDPTALAD